jgi:hypothetical protein
MKLLLLLIATTGNSLSQFGFTDVIVASNTQKSTLFYSTFFCHNAPLSACAKLSLVGVTVDTHFSTPVLNISRINRTLIYIILQL